MNLVLFFTRGVSLNMWIDGRLLEREKQIYEAHLNNGTLKEVTWLTYGTKDTEISAKLHKDGVLDSRIKVIGMPKAFYFPKFGSYIYSIFMPFLNRGVLRKADVFKTNQLDGAWAAIIGRWLYGKPVIARAGYVQSQLEKSLGRLSTFRIWFIFVGEWITLRIADRIVVAASHNIDYIAAYHGISRHRQSVLPNFIDIDLFAPSSTTFEPLYDRRLIFVGRFSAEKNLLALVEACSKTGLGLDLVGNGPLKDTLRQRANETGCDLAFLGPMANRELPTLFANYRFFILPSLSEGMPKTLIEAMACGLVCIGTNVTGIQDIIQDGVNGFLATDTDAFSLIKVIDRVFSLPAELIANISAKARQDVVDRYSLKIVAKLEEELLGRLVVLRSN